jgi:hypothetical protein
MFFQYFSHTTPPINLTALSTPCPEGASDRTASLRRVVLRRVAEKQALRVLRVQRAAEPTMDLVADMLGSATSMAGFGTPGHVERYWLKQVANVHLPMSRKRKTLQGHAECWDDAWRWLTARLVDRGVSPSLDVLEQCPELVAAYLAKVHSQSAGVTAVQRAASAINYVMDLHNLGKVANTPVAKAVKRSTVVSRKRPRLKAGVLSKNDVFDYVFTWGSPQQPEWKRWVALFVGLSTCTLMRWADGQIPLSCVRLPADETFSEVCMPQRKNRQNGETFWAAVPPSCTLKLLRDLITDSLGYSISKEGAVLAPDDAFLFPALIHVAGARQGPEAHWKVEPSHTKLSRGQYGVYLRRYRIGLQECCNMTRAEASLFSLHTGRRTGDTWMRKAKLDQEKRMMAGCWLAKDSEAMYNDMDDLERLELFSHTAV